jgi:hypothetical protein
VAKKKKKKSKCSCAEGAGCNDESRPLISAVTPKLIEAGSTEIDRTDDGFGQNNLRRALRARDTVEAWQGNDANDDIIAMIGDVLVDMQHLVRMLGADWGELVAKSGRCNAEEVIGDI